MVPKLKRLFKKQIIINKGTDWGLIVDSVVEPGPEPSEPVLFYWSWSRCEGPAPASP